MRKTGKTHLRLHTEETPHIAVKQQRGDDVAEMLERFTAATGWAPTSAMEKRRVIVGDDAELSPMGSINSRPRKRSRGSADDLIPSRWDLVDAMSIDGRLDVTPGDISSAVSQSDAEKLLRSIERLVSRMEKAEDFVRQHQATRASDIAVIRQADESKEVADRLLTILESSGRSIGAAAAAVYLLDDTTSELAMRACWNLPIDRLMGPPRPLSGSLADLEALLGNAVLLDDLEAVSEGWPSPETFASAIVVPIGTVAMPQGTIWFWSDQRRKYDPSQIEIANLSAGRVMNELEQSVLGAEVKESRRVRNQLDQASEAQVARLPDPGRLHQDFDLAGWSLQEAQIGGAFHDWDVNPRGSIVAAMGQAVAGGAQGALAAASAQAILRCGWRQSQNESQILSLAGDQLFALGEEDWSMHLTLVQLCCDSGRGSLVNGGSNQWIIASHRGLRPIALASRALACDPSNNPPVTRFVLQPGEVMIGLSNSLVQQLNLPDAIRAPGSSSRRSEDAAAKLRRHRRSLSRSLDQHPLLRDLQSMCDERAADIAEHFMRHMPTLMSTTASVADRSLVIIRNGKKCF